jgi:hypothetical protein
MSTYSSKYFHFISLVDVQLLNMIFFLGIDFMFVHAFFICVIKKIINKTKNVRKELDKINWMDVIHKASDYIRK